MKKRRQYIRNLIILAIACAVLAVAYFMITANEDPAAAGVLYKLGNDKITKVEIDNSYGSFTFEQKGGAWVVKSKGVYSTNPKKIDLLLSCLEDFKITRILPEEKSDYGFESPQAAVCVVTSGGKEHRFIVGSDAVSGSSVYIKSNGRVMLTSTGMTSQLTGSLAAYRAKDVLMVDPAKIRCIDYYVKSEKTLSLTNKDYQNWTMTYPFEAPARKVLVNELVAKLRSLTIAGYVDSNNENTGLSDPAGKFVLTDQAGVQQTLEIGGVSGNLRYVRIGAQDDIVQLYASDLDSLEMTPQEIMYIAPLDISIYEVQSISIQSGGTTDVFVMEHNGDDTIIKLNGATIPYSTFVSVYIKYLALNADGYDTEPASSADCKAVFTTTLLNGEKVELFLFWRDADTMYMLIDGKMNFYMQESSLAELLYRLQSAKNQA